MTRRSRRRTEPAPIAWRVTAITTRPAGVGRSTWPSGPLTTKSCAVDDSWTSLSPPSPGRAGLVFAEVGLITGVGGLLDRIAEREGRHPAPGERPDGVAGGRERVGVLAVA